MCLSGQRCAVRRRGLAPHMFPPNRWRRASVCVRAYPPRTQAFEDRTFAFDILPPPTSWYIKRVSGIAKGAKMPGKESVGTVSLRALYEVALSKQRHDPSLAVLSTQGIVRSLCGSAKSMGIKLVK